jgi:hypothetical protein
MHDQFRFDRPRRRAAVKAMVAMPVITLAVAVLATGCGTAGSSHAAGLSRAAAPPHATGPPRVTVAPHVATAAHDAVAADATRARSTAAAHDAIAADDAAAHDPVAAHDAVAADAAKAARSTGEPKASAQSRLVRVVRSSAAQTAQLPLATTYGTTPAAPQDPAPFGPETGTVVHPSTTRVIYASPGGAAVAELPATELGSPTWVPVVQSQPNWDRILLPTRPDRSTGWIYLGGGGLETAYTPYQVDIDLAGYRLTILDAGRSLGTWTVAEGAPGTPTPVGRTFVLASLVPLQPTYSPLILPLGTHSDTLTTFGGGPGTVGLHGWPETSVFGHAVSHGCVRVPAAALRALSQVPLGSAVMITG